MLEWPGGIGDAWQPVYWDSGSNGISFLAVTMFGGNGFTEFFFLKKTH